MRRKRNLALAAAALGLLAQSASGATVKAQIALVAAAGPGAGIGAATFTDTPNGAHIQLSLHGLPPGPHDFRIHANASCEPGLVDGTVVGAGGAGPNAALGELPALTVQSDGSDRETLTAPRIGDVAELKRRSVVVQAASGDARLACGVIN